MTEIRHVDGPIHKVLCLTGSESSALAALLYGIATGQYDIMLAPNHRESLMELYSQAYYGGARIDSN